MNHKPHSFLPGLLILFFIIFVNSGRIYAQSSAPQPAFVPGDAVEISVFPDTLSFLNGLYPIDGNGNVYLPVSGTLNVGGMSENDFITYLQRTFKQYLRSPNIQIRHKIRICMIGGFNRPGFYYVHPDESLWHAIYRAGGLTKEESMYELSWQRDSKVLAENMVGMLESGKSLNQLGFKSGDQLNVPLPDTPSFWEEAARFSPLLTVILTLFIAINTN